MSIAHVFSVDLEEYFHANALERAAPRERWSALPPRAAELTHRLLDHLAERGAHATFFTLGWLAEREPALVRRIAESGHEVASHGWWHRRVTELTPDQFRAEVRDSKRLLEDITGRPCDGFRAPSFSIRPGMDWALDVLLEEGYRYDSSLFPIRRPDYGYPSAPPVPHWIERPAGRLLELPLATTEVLGARVPAAGGGYLRQFPLALHQRAFREGDRDGTPRMFYIHPWDLDPHQPRLPVGAVTRFRHYRGLGTAWGRVEALTAEFRFSSAARLYSRSGRWATEPQLDR